MLVLNLDVLVMFLCPFILFDFIINMDSVVLKDSVALFPESIASVVRAPPNTGLDL